MNKFVEAWEVDLNPRWLRQMGHEEQSALLESGDPDTLHLALVADRDAIGHALAHARRHWFPFWMLVWLPANLMRRALDRSIAELDERPAH